MINGSKWWKFDFHTHTPISVDYEDQNLTSREWLLHHMNQEIDCVAVTDHNSGQWIDELKAELSEMKNLEVDNFRELVLFPGVEITVHGNIHVLAIFDPSCGSETISNLLSKCDYEGKNGSSDGCTKKSYNDVVEIVLKMNGIAIPAHVDQRCGLFYEERGNSLSTCLEAKGILAVQVVDHDFIKPQLYIDSKQNYTEVKGTDSHSVEAIGNSFSYVKMKTPNFAALRLALHDGDDGVINSDRYEGNPNDLKNRFFIKNIQIENGTKAGNGSPLKIDFSPWLNTIIGGRGSGKSSVLEYMRLPLNKFSGLPSKIEEEFMNFKKIPSGRGKPGMLQRSTKVRLELMKDDRDLALIWENDLISEELWDERTGTWIKRGESQNTDTRFPVRIFSQKQLYTLTEAPNFIIKIIDEQFDKKAWEEEYYEMATSWLELKKELRAVDLKVTSKKSVNLELDDIKAKMRIFEETGYKEVLENYQLSQALHNRLNTEFNKIEDFNKKLLEIKNQLPQLLFSEEELKHFDHDSKKMINEHIQAFNIIKEKFNKISEDFISVNSNSSHVIENLQWQNQRKEHIKKYDDFVENLKQAGEENPNAYGELVEKKRMLEQKLSDIESQEKKARDLMEKAKEFYNKINVHQVELRKYRLEVINKWQKENKNIKMYLEYMCNIDDAEYKLRNILRKTGNEYSKDILERDEEGNPVGGFIHDLSNSPNNKNRWILRNQIINEIISAAKNDNNKFSKYFTKHIKMILNDSSEDIDKLYLWFPEDKITLKIVNPSGKEEDIETGSAGQRTAAMLSLMLILDDSPLIIDQPEEDLDTKRITDLVVEGLRNFKLKQQIIVITHNPNIPVNGAAENIIHMNFVNGQIRKQISGALQEKAIRESICDVMEGGKDALDKRYFRISKALD